METRPGSVEGSERQTTQRKEEDIAQSAQNEKIHQIYKLQSEIASLCNRDKHIFNTTHLDTMLQSTTRGNKKQRFLECAEYFFFIAAFQKMAATGMTTNNSKTF